MATHTPPDRLAAGGAALTPAALTPAALRAQTVGIDADVETPFGTRPLVYADFTASGRQLQFVEDYLLGLAPLYANSHTEDSLTGRTATGLLHDAEAAIKRCVGAGPGGKVICCGTGATGATHKLQQILGIAIPPATRDRIRLRDGALDLDEQPVVFVGPFEHHSNEVTWREGLCTVVEVPLCPEGGLDLDALSAALADPRWAGRPLVGSFSAASNVTGVTSPVHEIARRVHAAGGIVAIDYAAGGPYLPIDMSADGDAEAALDAIFLAPHKFLGGPASSGVLVFNASLYPGHLSPSVGGGGTVGYVGLTSHDFLDDVEEREKAGTPGLYQILRAALALEVKAAVGADVIAEAEHAQLERALARWAAHPGVDVLGPADPSRRVGIVSFNVRDAECGTLHPKLVTVLLNDLFGIQSRAGCSCAGPYGHRLLGIGEAESERYRAATRRGIHGVKPGWCRVGFHFTLDAADADYVIDAVEFVAEHGARFLPLYRFEVATGRWTSRAGEPPTAAFSLADALAAAAPARPAPQPEAPRRARYRATLDEARRLAGALDAPNAGARLDGDLDALQFFALSDACAV